MRPRTINYSIDLQEEEKTACLAETAKNTCLGGDKNKGGGKSDFWRVDILKMH